jgi:hypothetical protein
VPRAQAQGKWPDKTVRIVAAGPAGGSADIIARLLADQLSKQIGQPVIVDPRAGAGGVLAVNELSLAARDGQTLLVGVDSLVSEIPHSLLGLAAAASTGGLFMARAQAQGNGPTRPCASSPPARPAARPTSSPGCSPTSSRSRSGSR